MKSIPKTPFGLGIALTVLGTLLPSTHLQAATKVWVGTSGGGSGTWGSTAPNHWNLPGMPTAADDAVFDGPGGVVSTPGSDFAARDLKFENGAYTLSINAGGGTVRNLVVDTFSGKDLARTTITSHNAGTINWTFTVSGSSAYTGTIATGDATSFNIFKAGAGFLDLSRASLAYNGNTTIQTGTLRLSGAASGAGVPDGGIQVGTASTTAFLEFDGKGNASTLTRNLNQGAGAIRIGSASDGGTAGIGAVNGPLTINLQSGANIAWGSAGGYFKVNIFQLGTTSSTDRVVWANNLQITGDRTIRGGGNGTLAVDGEFAGSLAMVGSGAANAVLSKDGTGTILFSGTSNAFVGRLHVKEGALLVGGRVATATTNTTFGIKVDAGAVLGGGGEIDLSNTAAKILVEGTLRAGDGAANKVLTLSSNLTMAENSILSFAIKGEDESDRIALDRLALWEFQSNQTLSIVDRGISLDGGVYTLVTGLVGFGSYDFSAWRVNSNAPLSGNLFYEGSTLYYQVVPEPSLFVLTGLGVAVAMARMRRRKAFSLEG